MDYNCQKISLEQTNAFSKELLDYINRAPELTEFYNQYPSIENFAELIKNKQFSKENRTTLVEVLEKQYDHLAKKPDFELLKKANTYTITTGHQLNIYSGPLYIIFKIVSIIKLAKDLKKAYPDYNFVPVYWMATEDHDLEEIDHFNAFGKKLKWETPQKGAVGRMNTHGLPALAENLGKAASIFKEAYAQNLTLADAVRAYMHELFHEHGLVSIDADDAALKSILTPVIIDDIANASAEKLVQLQTEKLQKLGYKTQINAREINFFYLDEQLRERLVKENDNFKVLGTEISFTQQQIQECIAANPEKFSPNVVLRPLYQELILPNLAYIGGPSEIVYWLQLKPVFDFYQVQFPALIPRNLAMLVDESAWKQCHSLDLQLPDLFMPIHDLLSTWTKKHSEKDLELKQEKAQILAAFALIDQKSIQIEPSLSRTSQAFAHKTEKLLQNLEKKFVRIEKRKFEEKLARISQLKEKLFPGGGLQERKENIVPILEKNPQIIAQLIEHFNPLDFSFNIIKF